MFSKGTDIGCISYSRYGQREKRKRWECHHNNTLQFFGLYSLVEFCRKFRKCLHKLRIHDLVQIQLGYYLCQANTSIPWSSLLKKLIFRCCSIILSCPRVRIKILAKGEHFVIFWLYGLVEFLVGVGTVLYGPTSVSKYIVPSYDSRSRWKGHHAFTSCLHSLSFGKSFPLVLISCTEIILLTWNSFSQIYRFGDMPYRSAVLVILSNWAETLSGDNVDRVNLLTNP